MSIIKIEDWIPPDTSTFARMQDLKEQPAGPYREILMAEDADGNPVPYVINQNGSIQNAILLRVPHGLSRHGTPIIPDVVIPIAVAYGPNVGIGLIYAAWEGSGFTPGGGPPIALPWHSKTRTWADDEYVYLLAFSFPTGEGGGQPVAFIVYIEYTHSVVRNEIITGAYEYYYLG